MPRHTWTEDDDRRLAEAVEVVAAVELPRARFWSAVVGRLLPEVEVTSDAARSRWDRLKKQRLDQGEENWRKLEERVFAAEADQLDHIIDMLSTLQTAVDTLNSRLQSIESEQRRMRLMWE